MNKPAHEIRDPIHGLIELSRKELAIINTRAFQRLRRIRQLAMAFLVYPGALHTRFDHSIGVMHIAGRICDRLKQCREITSKERKRVRLAALLHDIGHGPFSHVSEHLLDQHAQDETTGESPQEKIHEKLTIDIVKNDLELRRILTTKEREFIVEMIEGDSRRDFRRDIVSSDLDADKMDYLVRDSYFAGVKYGMYDLDKIIESCRVYRTRDESFLAISDQAIYALEQLLLARHHMTQQVYRHRVRSISDAMIIRGIELAIRDNDRELKRLYQYKRTPEFVETYMKHHDERLIDYVRSSSSRKAREIFDRLHGRNLFKMISELPLKDVEDALAHRQLLQIDDGLEQKREKQKWEKEIAAHLQIDADFVIINKLNVRNPNYGSRSYNLRPESVMVFDERQKKLKRLSQYTSELFLVRPHADETALATIQVYAPRNHWNTLSISKREKEELQLRERVQEILQYPL